MAEDSSPEELYSSLLKWLENCLALGGTLNFVPGEVNDGNALAECLVQLVPDYFTPSWRSRIITETGGNWKLKLNNLKKVYSSITSYYTDSLHIALDTFETPDLSCIAESGSKGDTSRLIQLVLGIAINCKHKDTYIQAIMELQKDVQHVVMGAIQNLMSYQTPIMVSTEDYKVLEEESRQKQVEVDMLKVECETLRQDNHDLTGQLTASQTVVGDLNTEVDTLKGKLQETQNSAGISGEVKVHQLQRALDQTKMDKLKIETERDDHKQKVEEMSVQVQELVKQNRNLQVENEEIPILRDSVEEMKYLESKVKSYESVISKYKKKVEDAQELAKLFKSMEDRNIVYMQQNLDLEEELRRQSNLKEQVDTHRQKVLELENALAQEKLRSLEASQDAEDKAQLVENLQAELMQVKRDRDHYSQQVPGTPISGGEFAMFATRSRLLREPAGSLDEPDLGSEIGVGLVEAYTPELREKMLRLEKENQILRRRLESAESASQGGVATEQVTREMVELKRQTDQAAVEVASLNELIKAKNVEIEKYKKYLNKAKKIIQNIGEKPQPEDSLETQALRNLLKDKDKHIDQLEKELSQAQAAWEREEKLVVSAWHEMGLMMHRRYSQDRLLSKHGTSFLSQQRQALYKNPVAINTSMTTTLSPSAPVSLDGHT